MAPYFVSASSLISVFVTAFFVAPKADMWRKILRPS